MVNETGSAYVTNAIAVLISLLLPCFFILIRRATITLLLASKQFFSWTYSRIQGTNSTTHDQATAENQHDEENQDATNFTTENEHDDPVQSETLFGKVMDQLRAPGDEDNQFKATKKVWKNATSRIELEDESNRPTGMWPEFLHSCRNFGQALETLWSDPALIFALLVVVVFHLVMLIVGIYVSVISADLVDGSVVSSASHSAGQWELDPASSSFILGGGAVIAENRQSRAWAYRYSCYPPNANTAACNIFYSQQIPMHPQHNASCPFDGDACLYGDTSAYEVTTGLLDSNLLGVNAPASKRFHFRRTMSCAPLQSNETYIFPSGDDSYPSQWLYNYGIPSFSFGPFWNITYMNPREWRLSTVDTYDVPGYGMG